MRSRHQQVRAEVRGRSGCAHAGRGHGRVLGSYLLGSHSGGDAVPKITLTGTRVPAITAWPCITAESAEIIAICSLVTI